MTERPIKASQVEKVDEDKSSDDAHRSKAKRAVRSRSARRAAIKGAGGQAAVGLGSPALAESLEQRMKKRVDTQTAAFRAQKAAERAVATKRGEQR